MISFRYHIVSIVSVFLALAVGVALGGGPLKGEVDKTLVEQVEKDRMVKADLRAEIGDARTGSRFTDDFARAAAPDLLGTELRGRVVTVMVLPGATQSDVTAISELIEVADGRVGGVLRIGGDMLDVAQKQLIDELGAQLLDATPGVDVADDASGYERMGALLARAVGTQRVGGARVDEAANGILSGLSTAGLMSAEGDIERRGGLIVILAGSGSGSVEELQGANTIVGALARELDAGTNGTVVAGPVASAQADGLVESIRQDVVAARDVSTVDSLDRVAGQVVTVMALKGQASGEVGHYGAVDTADGAMPGAIPAD